MMKDKRTEPPGRVRFVLGAAVFLLLSGAAFWAIAAFVGDGMPRFDPRLVAPGSLALIALFLFSSSCSSFFSFSAAGRVRPACWPARALTC